MANFDYVDPSQPGYTRCKRRTGWHYLYADGRLVRSRRIVERLDRLAVPPAYDKAWYAPSPRAHIQATGIDARGRKQYIYHPIFRSQRDDAKYEMCKTFARALPPIREKVAQDLASRQLSKVRVVAAVVRLLDLGQVRVGNRGYAKANGSFGATTLKGRHAKVHNERVLLDYIGKSGKRQRIGLNDKRLARLVTRCKDLPGQDLFQYVDDENIPHPVTSSDVNAYLREHGADFSAKDFRTWGASVIAFGIVARSKGRATLKQLLQGVADRLGNTPAIARKSYVHPAIIEAILDPPDLNWRLPRATAWLNAEERGFVQFIESSSASDANGGS